MSLKSKFLKHWPLIAAVVAGLGYIGLDLTGLRPVWFFEHSALAADFYSAECKRLKTEWYTAKETSDRYRERSQPTPPWLIEKIVDLEAEIRRIECAPRRPD